MIATSVLAVLDVQRNLGDRALAERPRPGETVRSAARVVAAEGREHAMSGTRTSLIAVLMAGYLIGPASADTRRTIVGKWSTPEGKCVRPVSLLQIGPKSLSGDDFFLISKRCAGTGDVGGASPANAPSGDDPPKAETVVARLAGQRLYYRFKSERGENGPFVRCR